MDQLYQLAELYGIQPSYYDVAGQLRHAAADALVQVLRSMGAAVEKIDDAADALRERQQALWRRRLEPVTVAWDPGDGAVAVRLPSHQADSSLHCHLALESGATKEWSCRARELAVVNEAEVEGVRYTAKRLSLPQTVPLGYHRLRLELDGSSADSLIVAAPLAAYEPADGSRQRSWGAFLPLYALHSDRSWGAGDLSDLEALTDWVTGLGGGLVATLPLLAAFLDEPFEPGPYAPASRLFWNELYLDVARIPEVQRAPAAQALLASREFREEVRELRSRSLVDYRRQMALKRRVLAELARSFFAEPGERGSDFERFVADHAHVEEYARFRAVGERLRGPWPAWPAPLRDGKVQEGDYDEENKRYHLYVQWLADEQLRALAAKARTAGPGLYLDLPLGVNSDSYDVWRERSSFASGIAAGAPPDPFFAKGQNWGFPPLHPDRMREQGYRYVIAYLRHHLQLAGVLRIDHMMGFHRLFWIPHGGEAREGIYVRYPAEELYAVFNLESHRYRSILVGEDLGTVPPEVRPAMADHNVHRMYVLQYELQPQYQNALTPVYPGCVACLNTHDMPPFAAFCQGLDIQERVELGILDPAVAEAEHQQRQAVVDALVRSLRLEGWVQESAEPKAILRACLKHMASGPALVVLANLEDLWLETQPQNLPGTWHERPNWRRRARYSLEAMSRMPEVLVILREINQVLRTKAEGS